MKTYKIRLWIMLLIMLSCFSVQAQKKDKQVAVKNMIDKRNYNFIAQTAIPTSGRTWNLTTEYTLTVTKDSIMCYLPYFGRAYVAPMDPTKGGIEFKSKKFDYKSVKGRKGGWDITITPNDTEDVRQLQLSISDDGYASLNVNSNNRQAISFNGYIEENTPKK
ncbi:DUF4251 domain-containing protein [Pedobacter sp. BS3]|uniref:DUF4251 domain-containing protein n=1 Tax=Pedobacter sp. BS3 TaxID=2567937 RepID=UPI0011ED46AE|nr:DUF4251 domain-containing protein [Pedobacter sp. BS3]TZF84486.1 DUF4251 domain-containing protein [Pedobacter sp. BS3]